MIRFVSRAAAAAAVSALALPLALAATPAAAQPAAPWDTAGPARIAIAYSDAELHSAAGAKAVAHRIRIAADKVCGGED
ncbi:MAG TPA: UrcA family protein, partial [Caulobacteraceae bacterium]|nr:UrcA family protein [Caulobacteraceae bacterium]